MSHPFNYLTTKSPVHRALLSHLVEQHRRKTATARIELPTDDVPVEERVMMRAFSEELNKLAFLGPLLAAAGEALPWALGGELAYEGVDRLTNPTAQHRTPFQIAKDVGMSTVLHAPISVGLKGLDNMRGVGPAGSMARWVAEKSYGPLSFLGSFFDPKAQAAWRAGQPLIEKALGVERAPDPAKMTQAQRGVPGVAQGGSDLSPSYLELRKMDPRYVSSRWMT